MRLWSIHPEYLDARGLVALWREALLAQSVLRGRTKGYLRHPQLSRFRAQDDPTRRGYRFDAGRISPSGPARCIDVSDGQIAFEWAHLTKKLARRAPDLGKRWMSVNTPRLHPLFQVVEGRVADWERPRPAPPAMPVRSRPAGAIPNRLSRRYRS